MGEVENRYEGEQLVGCGEEKRKNYVGRVVVVQKWEGWGRGETGEEEEERYIGAAWCGAKFWRLKSRLAKSAKHRGEVKIEQSAKVKLNQL